ncbi:MAG: hypothetical protein JSW61_12990 [Candidatus Thorarchaeota archaeon]|nr:MAG: hypothetical protein JSW61_12990 [Candidatus Thorarchaeota archaeon]
MLMTRFAALSILTALLICSLVTYSSAQSTYPVINIDYKEIRLVPENFSHLITEAPAFGTDSSLTVLLGQNSTVFWEALGQFGPDLEANFTANSYSVVQLNDTGIFISVIGLDVSRQSVEWIHSLPQSAVENYSLILNDATDFFSDDGHYWGLCEEIVLVPGSLVDRTEEIVWRLIFYLVAESERWTLLYSANGMRLDTLSTPVPCQTCDYSLYLILGVSGAITAIVFIGYLRTRTSVS